MTAPPNGDHNRMSQSEQPAGRPRLLVVDDEQNICSLLREMLSDDGYQVTTCRSAQQALERMAGQPYDMIISDLKMPGMSGTDLIRQVKKQWPETTAVLFTGYATVETAVEAMRYGADDYVTKPFNIDELRKVVKRGLESKLLRRRNRELIGRLRSANEELQRHKADLRGEMLRASESLLETNRRLEKRVQQLNTIMEVTRAIRSILDLDRLLDVCLKLIARELKVEDSSIMLARPGGQWLVVRAAHGPNAENVLGKERKRGDGVAGWVAEYKEPLLISDLSKSPIFATEYSMNYHGQSFLCLPLVRQKRVLGVLNLTSKDDGRPFTEGDREFAGAIADQIAVAIENAALFDTVQQNSLSAVQALAESLEARDPYTSGHSARVTDYATRLAKTLGVTAASIETLRHAGRLHDIGKLGIQEATLHKPGPLSDDEWGLMREHPAKGERIVQSLGFLDRAREVVRHHHERWDGTGYPDGLKGEELPFLTRILSIADSYDAMTSERPYRGAKTHRQALGEIEGNMATQFDPALAQQFVTIMADGPAGRG